jgi:hypothetical protein
VEYLDDQLHKRLCMSAFWPSCHNAEEENSPREVSFWRNACGMWRVPEALLACWTGLRTSMSAWSMLILVLFDVGGVTALRARGSCLCEDWLVQGDQPNRCPCMVGVRATF